jgi:hypothetical protein
MATETTTVTHYGVARGEKLIGAGSTYLPAAQEALTVAEQQMIAVGLDPDVRLVEYDVETTVKAGRVRAYKEPTDEVPDAEPTADTAGA